MAMLLAGAVAAAGVITFTACGDGTDGVPKGEEVTAEQWKTAITATSEVGNYTAEIRGENVESASGKVGDKTVNYVGKETIAGKLYFDYNSKKILLETNTTLKTTGAELFGEEDEEETSEHKSYNEVENLTIWAAVFDDAEWKVYSNTAVSQDSLNEQFLTGSVLYSFENSLFSTTEDGQGVKITELYSAFTYSNGVYSAALYLNGDRTEISMSFKDGYVVGVSQTRTEEGVEEDTTYKTTYKYNYVFSDFGKTVVTTPAGAAEAIAAEKSSGN